ncbi:MAG: hypothetical protein KJ970_15570 [Candidatus Eisenbacteria bacterium]|uniref:Uncharacterized protein n=1 Tax=Eiseniibacteriota bacterium TaxID=2212470 RepID=A0A948RYK4_UNCEI|nr:hypothetical protein [Candidatus Eisenbacteria bacterium]
MNREPNPKTQMPAGKARHAAGVDWGDRELIEVCTRTLDLQNDRPPVGSPCRIFNIQSGLSYTSMV